jgi:hypothetical protein
MNLSDIIAILRRGIIIRVDWVKYPVKCDVCDWAGEFDFESEAHHALKIHKQTCNPLLVEHKSLFDWASGKNEDTP